MNIHSIVLIAQIKLADSNENFYRRKTAFSSGLIDEKLNNESKYKIEHLIAKKISIKAKTKFKKFKYLIK